MTKNKKKRNPCTISGPRRRDYSPCKPKKAPRVPESDNKMHNKANGNRKAGSKTISERSIIVMNACRGKI